MNDYYLKAADAAALTAALTAAGVLDQYGNVITGALDVIGTIHKPTGEKIAGEDGMTFDVTAPLPGWHANLRADLTPEQLAQLPTIPAPTTPVRVWA